MSIAVRQTTAAKPTKVRLGVILRMAAVGALALLLILDGGALTSHFTSTNAGHYTVVMKPGSDSRIAIDEAKSHGLKIEKTFTNGLGTGFVTTANPDKASALTSYTDVSYVELDNTGTTDTSFINRMKLKLGL